MDKNKSSKANQNIEKENTKQKFEEILAKESPELFLKLKKHETEPRWSPPLFSEPVKLLIFIVIIDAIVALLMTVITKKSHFTILGSAGLWLSIPWWLASLDGFIFIGYGVYVIKRKRGELDVNPTSSGKFEVHEIKGEATSVLGLIYILLGIFLVGVVIFRCFIQGIF